MRQKCVRLQAVVENRASADLGATATIQGALSIRALRQRCTQLE